MEVTVDEESGPPWDPAHRVGPFRIYVRGPQWWVCLALPGIVTNPIATGGAEDEFAALEEAIKAAQAWCDRWRSTLECCRHPSRRPDEECPSCKT